MNQRILITGGTGLIGTHLSSMLSMKGYKVNILTRNLFLSPYKQFQWNIEKGEIDLDAFNDVDYIVHLAGANVFNKWSNKYKKELIDSRILSTRLLYEGLKKVSHKVKSIICASAIGYYNHKNPDKVCDESGKKGNDFLSNLVDKWEKEQIQLKYETNRIVQLRFGVVLSDKGGILETMKPFINCCLASPMGKGSQWINWIHIDDLSDLIIFFLLNEEMEGIVNAVAPNSVTNKEFVLKYASFLKKPCIMPNVPSFFLKLFIGERANMVINGAKVISEKLSKTNFKFVNNTIEDVFIYNRII